MRQDFTFEHQAGEKKEHRKKEKRRLSSKVKYSCIKDDKSIWLDSRFTKVRYNFGIEVDKNFETVTGLQPLIVFIAFEIYDAEAL